ncbi:hypothetical protein [Actinomadura sp. 6N118]|uniref:hypothetical protein n=1 Tax=Actinomadura sp. 6N118 TaxID=3375151 RepID=UPI003793D470
MTAHQHVQQCVHSMMTGALRADPAAIDKLLVGLEKSQLDVCSRDFVREARRLVLASSAALSTILGPHKPGDDPYGRPICHGCGTSECRMLRSVGDVFAAYSVRPMAVDRAEAWRRADAFFGGTPLRIEEFEEGFVARPCSNETGALLMIDRRSGVMSRWPSELSREQLIPRYRSYVRGEL